jgi:hypothetical protein
MKWRAAAEGAGHLVNEARADQGDPVSLRPAASRCERMCLRSRSLPDPMLSSLNSPLFGISNSGQLWTLLLLAKVVFGIRQGNQSSHSARSHRDQGDGRPGLCGRKESLMRSLCRKKQRRGSGSGPEDNNPDFHPTNESYQRLVDKDDCKSSSVSRCDGSKRRFALCVSSEVQRWRGSQNGSEHGNKGARRAVA